MKQKMIIVIIVILIIIAGIYIYTKNNATDYDANTNQTNNVSQDSDTTNDVPSDPQDDPQTPTSDTIAVSTQIPGNAVTIDNAFLSKPGFITIHEVTNQGATGKIIGTSGYLSVGPKQDLEITAKLVPGAKYIAMIHADNGDKKFNEAQDSAITSNNAPVMTMFSVSQ